MQLSYYRMKNKEYDWAQSWVLQPTWYEHTAGIPVADRPSGTSGQPLLLAVAWHWCPPPRGISMLHPELELTRLEVSHLPQVKPQLVQWGNSDLNLLNSWLKSLLAHVRSSSWDRRYDWACSSTSEPTPSHDLICPHPAYYGPLPILPWHCSSSFYLPQHILPLAPKPSLPRALRTARLSQHTWWHVCDSLDQCWAHCSSVTVG